MRLGIVRHENPTYVRGEALAKAKLSKEPGIYFARATPAHGYADFLNYLFQLCR